MPRPRNFDTDEVLDKAMLLFWKKGYAGATLDELETATGLKRVSLYNAFGDKKTLFLAVLRRYRSEIAGRVLAPLNEPGGGLDAIRGVFDGFLKPPAGPGGCLMVNTSVDENPLDPGVQQQVDEHFAAVEGSFERALERARADGGLQPSVDTARGAAWLTTALQGIAVLSRARRFDSVRGAVEVLRGQLDSWRVA